MKLQIHIKGAGRRQNRITQIVYDYPLQEMSVEEFLAETVRQTVRAYNERRSTDVTGSAELLQLFSEEALQDRLEQSIADQAQTGKVTFSAVQERSQQAAHRADENKAIENALQAFEDGIVAVFVDGVRYTEKEQRLLLKEDSEATFVKLTFLAGRIW